MWITAKRAEDGAAVVIPEDDIAGIWQAAGADHAVILMKEAADQKHQTVTEISVHHTLADAVLAMVKIARPETDAA